jgi:putative oxidoreductase
MKPYPTQNRPSAVPALGRAMMAILFLFSGIGKVIDPGHTIEEIRAAGLPFAHLGLAIAIGLGLGGGAMLALGIRTRMVATVLALYCVVAGLIFHNPTGGIPQLVHLIKNFAIAGGLLQVAAFGPGSYAFDNLRTVRKSLRRA